MSAGAGRPTTGDRVVDQALADLDGQLQDGADPVAAVVEAHRLLQQRLTAPAADPEAPGRARPGPAG
ncbi:MAG TPA: hypothetical protein VLO09_02465 [Ornithinimicrobium sp.]|nr:hypothetical protein [Ornithinimicrobium sp.]